MQIAHRRLSRRGFLVGAAGTVLVACGGDDGGGSGNASDVVVPGANADGYALVAGFDIGFVAPSLVAGVPQRAPFVAITADGVVRIDAPDGFDVELRRDGEVLEAFTLERHDAAIPTPYYPLAFTVDEPGDYEVVMAGADTGVGFAVGARNEIGLVQVGDALRPVDTPTFDDARGVDPICTQVPEPCPYHEVTLTEAVASGQPTVFLISTPGFCQTDICGPVLALLVEELGTDSGVTVVHSEVYTNPNEIDPASGQSTTTEAIGTYELTYEPSLYVADATGTVTARLDFTWDQAELTTALATL